MRRPKERLRALRQRCDPVLLLAEIRAARVALGERVDRRGATAVREVAPLPADLDRFVASLKTAWREGERRRTHKRAYRRRKPVPKRGSMLDAVREEIHGWLDAEPRALGQGGTHPAAWAGTGTLPGHAAADRPTGGQGVARPLGARDHPG
jgi:hypothetical protein